MGKAIFERDLGHFFSPLCVRSIRKCNSLEEESAMKKERHCDIVFQWIKSATKSSCDFLRRSRSTPRHLHICTVDVDLDGATESSRFCRISIDEIDKGNARSRNEDDRLECRRWQRGGGDIELPNGVFRNGWRKRSEEEGSDRLVGWRCESVVSRERGENLLGNGIVDAVVWL